MCRYARKTYKSHYTCFKCRKSFKQTDTDDILLRIKKDKIYHQRDGTIKNVSDVFTKAKKEELDALTKEINARQIKCPECGTLMADLGRDFKAPKKTAVKEWKIVEGLFQIGRCFHSCGCDGIGYIPKKPKDYEQYLRNTLHEYESYVVSGQNKTHEEFPERMEYINFWTERVSGVKAEMIRQKFEII
ncbi:hypothetical protein B0A69_05655 [Chryseobacterium shigense]|uniref:Uncharacterized protein n=1 Tax=Chryseobacterium shigense TaxID=297244 RepID=A0A1N7IKW4_9FLAO|nr:hypothetical protein [Chryseobacterium shigense]PQA95854.1 hypothetical protein B0A69_05655 [Chryseobacterium shigense]SIS37626.1 hypothetical protein SAMN05421639_104134 [Chryseobacterium shigense]